MSAPRRAAPWRAAAAVLAVAALCVDPVAPGPVAPPVVVFAGRGEEVVVKLAGHDPGGRALAATVVTPPGPGAGALHDLSALFVAQGLQPRRGKAMGPPFPAPVPPAAGNRVLYVAPAAPPPAGAWGNFSYRVADGAAASPPGTVWVIPPHKRLASSDFRADGDGWRVSGGATLAREAYSRGALAQYIVGTDGAVAAHPRARGDGALWHFHAPPAFLGNKLAAFGGTLTFTAGAFAGDFSPGARHAAAPPLVVLECAGCAGGQGIRLGHFPPDPAALDGKTKKFTVALAPAAWARDPRNTLAKWGAVGDCELAAVLRGLTGLSILGDWSTWYETVAIDDVALNVAQPWPGIPKACYGIG
jgi:hypothetical protein